MEELLIEIVEEVTDVSIGDDNLLIESIEQGEPGASISILTYVAGVVLGGHRAVLVDVSGSAIYADKDTPSHYASVIGITTASAGIGASVPIQTFGELTEGSWTWTAKLPIYLGANGTLTQTPPSTGFQLMLGFAISTTKIFIDIKEAIDLL